MVLMKEKTEVETNNLLYMSSELVMLNRITKSLELQVELNKKRIAEIEDYISENQIKIRVIENGNDRA